MAKFFFDLEDLNRNSGLAIYDVSLATSTFPLTSGADYNGDEIDDLVVSPTTESLSQIEIIYGGDELPANLYLEDLEEGTKLEGDSDNLLNPVLFSSNLDFNGDDLDDLIYVSLEGSTLDDVDFASRLIFGSEDLPANIALSELDGTDGLEFSGSPVFAQAIDINNDGNDDLIFSVDDLESAEPSFANYVFFGDDSDFDPTLDPTAIDDSNGFEIDTGGVPLFVGVARDINDDGFNDLAIDSADRNNAQNTSSILFGSADFPETIDPSNFDGDDGFSIVSSDAGEDEVISSSLIEDLNGDEIADILVSQATLDELDADELADTNGLLDILSTPSDLGNVSGQKVFAVFGNETFDEIDLMDLDGDDGFAIVNSDSDELNIVNTTTLDLNNDQLQDLVINDLESDRTYVILGQSEFEAEIDLADLDGDNGFVLSEFSSNYTNSYTGDLNGDSLDDLILETDSDRTYVVYGTEDDFEAEFDPTADTNTLVIFAQSEDLTIQNIIDLNGDGADDIVYTPPLSFDSLLEPDATTDIPDLQVVYGDTDLGTAA